jgi:glycosyltransferase involved in cell wall biosynthesis
MQNSLVSVIIPTYNRRHLLEEAIKSVLRQTYRTFELIVIDDGSTDGTADFMQDLLKQDSRISYHQFSRKGAAAARNKGIKLSKGSFAAFLDSDDLWLETKLEKQMLIFEKAPALGFVYCNGFFIDEEGQRDEHLTTEWKSEPFSDVKDILLKRVTFFSTSGVIIRKPCLTQAGSFDEDLRFFEDIDLFFRVLTFCKGYLVNEELVVNRRHSGNLANQYRFPTVEFSSDFLKMRRKTVDFFEQHVAPLTPKEREIAVDQPHITLIKEYLAFGQTNDAKREIDVYLKTHGNSVFGWTLRALTLLPSKILSRLILQRRKFLKKV